jgi:hypothetical protein
MACVASAGPAPVSLIASCNCARAPQQALLHLAIGPLELVSSARPEAQHGLDAGLSWFSTGIVEPALLL